MALLTFPRFVTAASAATLAMFVAQWAAASTDLRCESWADEPSTAFACELEADRAIGALCGEAPAVLQDAWQVAYRGCVAQLEADEYSADDIADDAQFVADALAYQAAWESAGNAPEFCVVTYIEPDATRGYVAVCVLDTDDATPAPVPFRVAGAL